MRISAAAPRRPPIQQVPSRCTASMTRSVSVGVAEGDEHLVEHDVVHDLDAAARQLSANRRASAQQRSTSSATPSRPSSRRAAQTANPRARRDDSSVRSRRRSSRRGRSGTRRCRTSRRRARRGARRRRSRSRTGTFSHLCPSQPHESANSMPSTRCRGAGLAAAHRPNAPSTCTHAPCARARRRSRREVVARARVHVPRLRADDRRAVGGRCQRAAGQRRDVHRAVAVGRHPLHAAVPKPEQPQGPIDVACRSTPATTRTRGAPIRPSARRPSPPRPARAARRRRAHRVRRLGPGDEAERSGGGDSQQLLQPSAVDFFGGRGGEQRVERGLVPARSRAGRQQRRGSAPPITKPK